MGKSTKKSNESFFSSLFSSLFSSSDPEAEKKRVLKNIAKQIAKSKYKFYKTGQNAVLPAMAKYFYDIYKAISPAQAVLANPQAVAALKNCIIDYSMSDKQRDALAQLSEEAIRDAAKNLSVKELTKMVKDSIHILTSGFDSNRVTKIDLLYEQFLQFVGFVKFDYYFLLKKFDAGFQERNFTRTPEFTAIRADYVTDELKDFIAVAWGFQSKSEWGEVFAFIKAYRQADPMALNVWNKVVNRVCDLRLSQTLELIIRYATNNPSYEPSVEKKSQSVVENYVDKIRVQAESIVKRVAKEKKNSKADELLNSLFGTTDIEKLKNYTPKANEYFEKRALPCYTYCLPLNYMKAFLVDYFKCDVRNVNDLVVVRGKWRDPSLSQEMSNAYNNILAYSERITVFDDSLSETLDKGNKIKMLSTRAERDKTVVGQLQASLKNVNGEAFQMLKGCSQEFVVFAKTLKLLIEDVDNPKAEILTNWKEVAHASDGSLKATLVAVYKKIYLFISLMQTFLSDGV